MLYVIKHLIKYSHHDKVSLKLQIFVGTLSYVIRLPVLRHSLLQSISPSHHHSKEAAFIHRTRRNAIATLSSTGRLAVPERREFSYMFYTNVAQELSILKCKQHPHCYLHRNQAG